MKTEVGLSPRIARLKSTLIPKSFRSTISWHPELGEREDITSAYRRHQNCVSRAPGSTRRAQQGD